MYKGGIILPLYFFLRGSFFSYICYNIYSALLEGEEFIDEKKTYMIRTYGCQMKRTYSEKISWILENMNYTKKLTI